MGEEDRARVTYYPDASGEWRWRFQSPSNWRVLGDSGEGYKERADAVNGFGKFCLYVGGNPALVEVVFEEVPGDGG